jgi:hypothetical protein
MKRGIKICSIILLFLMGLSFISAAGTHSADVVQIVVDGVQRALNWITISLFQTGTHTYTLPVLSIPGHDASSIWVSVKDGEMTLFNALQSTNKLCPANPVKPSYTSPSIPNPSHLGTEVTLDSGESLQKSIDDENFCCVPNCAEKNCGDDGCGGVCGTCTLPQICGAIGVCGRPCVANYNTPCGASDCKYAGQVACDGSCINNAPKAYGEDCDVQNVDCWSGEWLNTNNYGTKSACSLAFGKCDSLGNCIQWKGTGCESCPFGTTTYTSFGNYPKNTVCKPNGNLATFTLNGAWFSWVTIESRPCNFQNEVSCGVSCKDVVTTNVDWVLKP